MPPPSAQIKPAATAWHTLPASRLLVFGERGHRLIEWLNERGAIVEHWARSEAQAARIATTHPARRIREGWEHGHGPQLPHERFPLAASLEPFSAANPLRLVLSSLASSAEAFVFEDNEACNPAGESRAVGSYPSPSSWPARRCAFLARTLQEFGFSLRPLATTESEAISDDAGEVEPLPLYLCERQRYRPLLVHAHVPKTGGISIRKLLEESFPGRCLPIDVASLRGDHGNLSSIHSLLLQSPHVDVIASHLLRFSYPNVLGDRLMLYFTLLREPVDQFSSFVRFVRYNYSLFDANARRVLPAGIPEMSLVEIADALMDDRGLDSCSFMTCRFFGLTDIADPVIRRLMGFLLVGIFERMDESIQLLERRLRPYGLTLNPAGLPHLNSSRGASSSKSPLPDNHSEQERALDAHEPIIRRFIEESAPAEFEVYEWACSQFESQWQARDSAV